jgi:hypothetical protein
MQSFLFIKIHCILEGFDEIKLIKSAIIRERPFNLKGGGLCFFSKKNILIPNDAEKNILILVEEKKII